MSARLKAWLLGLILLEPTPPGPSARPSFLCQSCGQLTPCERLVRFHNLPEEEARCHGYIVCRACWDQRHATP